MKNSLKVPHPLEQIHFTEEYALHRIYTDQYEIITKLAIYLILIAVWHSIKFGETLYIDMEFELVIVLYEDRKKNTAKIIIPRSNRVEILLDY